MIHITGKRLFHVLFLCAFCRAYVFHHSYTGEFYIGCLGVDVVALSGVYECAVVYGDAVQDAPTDRLVHVNIEKFFEEV